LAKRIIKKKEIPEPVPSFQERFTKWVKKNLKAIGIVSGIILIITAIILIFLIHSKNLERRASYKLSIALNLYNQAVYSQDIKGEKKKLKEVLKDLEDIEKRYKRTDHGKKALLYIGHIYYHLKDYDNAIKFYRRFLKKTKKDDLLKIMALNGLGYANEEKADFKEAIKWYSKILNINNRFFQPYAHLNMARCFEKLKNIPEAIKNYREFLKENPDSERSLQVKYKVKVLEEMSVSKK